jgi:dienelactone hydrolase
MNFRYYFAVFRNIRFVWTLLIMSLITAPAHAQQGTNTTEPEPQSLPSERPSGFERNDQIWFSYYPAPVRAGERAPAVILLHHLGTTKNQEMPRYARYLNQHHISAVVMTLPYHMRRAVRGIRPVDRFAAPQVEPVVQAFDQSASDVGTLVTWLSQQPSVDPRRIGAVGVSLGAITTHLAMGRDERIRAGVAFLGGGDLADINQNSVAGKLFLRRKRRPLSTQELDALKAVDPLTYANRNQPRRVLMVQAARDAFIPPRDAEVLWEALGRPPIQWMDTNHVAIQLASRSAMRAATQYLQAAWQADATQSSSIDTKSITQVRPPTIKVGVISGLDSIVTPAIQYQALAIGRRNHMSLLNVNAGLSRRGPFMSLAATVNAYIDAGVAKRLGGGKVRPYVSWHVVF